MERQSPLISVFWVDATSTDEWTSRTEVEHRCNVIQTVGILVDETKDTLTVALNHDLDSDNLSCFIVIPQAWIKSREELYARKRRNVSRKRRKL